MKIIAPAANIKAADSWTGGNFAAVRALFMIAAFVHVHRKTLTSTYWLFYGGK
jgi:hypothetical protein